MALETTFTKVRQAARKLNHLDPAVINGFLLELADEAENASGDILSANAEDLRRMDADDPRYDRLLLTEYRIREIASGLRKVAGLPSPSGRILKQAVLPNGLHLRKVSVPFGVIGIVYEARPNVTFDVVSLCLKAGNACVLKGGKDADASNRAIVRIIHRVLERSGIDENTVALLPATHEATAGLLEARNYVDLLIPRGGRELIKFVRDNSKVPVIETGAGVCHTYFDKDGDREKGSRIIVNAKTRRVSVCNALDCLLVHVSRLRDLPYLVHPMAEKQVVLHADGLSLDALKDFYPGELLQKAVPEDDGREYLSYDLEIKTVSSLEDALMFIDKNGSHHSECIITENEQAAARFLKDVDAACVYHNAPTSFTDGGQFGLGAEIGISTQKLHARGPMGVEEITTYKWLVEGDGQIRP